MKKYFQLGALSRRQLEVFNHLCDGRTNEEIGLLLGCATITARDHVNKIIERLDAIAQKRYQLLLEMASLIKITMDD
jgi:DNA-binding NarL/FixJ family response regulator